MKKLIIFVLGVIILVSCDNNRGNISVAIYGELYKIMHLGEREGVVSISDVISDPHVYGLGALEGLNGEIVILDGQILINRAAKGEIPSAQTNVSNSEKALLLVAAQVENWNQMSITKPETISTIDAAIKHYAKEMKIDTNKPFPFIIEGEMEMVNWHIISSPEPGGGHDEHLAGSWSRIDQQKNCKILGFYSENHQAVFTHHTTYTHMHVIFENDSLSGHVDDLIISPHWTLSVPLKTNFTTKENGV